MRLEVQRDSETHKVLAPIWYPLMFVGALWLIHVGMNLLWRHANVMVLGWDQSAHLVRSLEYLRLLQPFSLEGALNVLTQDPYYPPFFHISTVVFYSLFGISADSAAMTNVVYLAVLLLSVYGIGRQLYDTPTGLFAAGVVSFFPIVFNLSRFIYLDFALMALVALSTFLLLKSDHFRQRRWAYLFGISLGLGLLTKWDFVVFAGVPCLYVLLRSPVAADLRAILRAPRPQWTRLVVAIAAGLLAAGLCFVPGDAWQAKAAFALPLAILYWAVVSAVVYVGSLPSRPFNSFVGSMCLALGIAGIWYVPDFNFIKRGLYAAYYVGSETRPAFHLDLSTLPIWTLLGGIVSEHLSVPIALFLLILMVIWFVRSRRTLKTFSVSNWLIGLWFVIPLAFFASFSNQTSVHVRLIVPLVLPLAIALARGCLSIRSSTFRRSLTGALLVIAVVQWLVLSLDVFAAVPAYTAVQLPGWGAINWFAGGEFAQWPASHQTDKGYWIAPAIFRQIVNEREDQASGPTTLGLLVDQPYLNINHAVFLAARDYPQVEVVDLSRHRKRLPVYPQLFNLDYVLVSDSGMGGPNAADQSAQVVTSILTQPTAEFKSAFRPIAEFKTPNGDVVHLFRNQTYEPPRSIPPKLVPRGSGQPANVNFGNQLLLMSYAPDTAPVARDRRLKVDLFWLGLARMRDDYRMTLKLLNSTYQIWGQQQGHPGWDSFPTQKWAKGEVTLDEREIPVLPGTPPGSYQLEVTVYGVHNERDLPAVNGQPALLGPIELPRQVNLSPKDIDVEHPLQVDLDGKLRLLGYKTEGEFQPGQTLHLTLFWQALAKMDQDYTIFTHLIDAKGTQRGQKDNQPVNGFYPTSRWEPNEIVRDPYEIHIDANAPSADYQIEVGAYQASSGVRLPISTLDVGAGLDRVILGPFHIETNGHKP